MIRLLRQALILLAGVSFCTECVRAQEELPGEQRHIREIRIYVGNIYSEEQTKTSSWARSIDRYHIKTRERVIRTQLLFKEGDVVDEELLAASERSLRWFAFLNYAEVKAVPVDDETVDVEVHTREAWSLVPGFDINGGGGLATGSLSLSELNFLGYGKKLFVEAYYANDVGTTWTLGYSDYQMFGTRWIGTARYRTGPLVDSFFLSARRPLYSPDSKWAYGGSAYTADQIIRRFEEGEESDRFEKDQDQAEVSVKRSFGRRYHKIHLKFATNYMKADFDSLGAATTDSIPPDQENLTPSVSLDTESLEYEKYTFINKMGIVEDKWLGIRYGGTLGYGIPLGDGFVLWKTRLFVMNNTDFSHGHLLGLRGSVESEVVRNTIVTAGARYYKKFSRHTVATHFSTRLGYNLDPSIQFNLGADSGLRGYSARQFTGEKKIIMNLEDRQFWGEISLGPKFAIGTVVFVDAGNVWKEEETIDLDDLNWSAGFGFRIGGSNFPHQPILRIDLGWGIGNDSFAVTIGQEQQF